jgi:hypothetical protein
MQGTIYRIFNTINDKSYVGKTYANPYKRLAEHIRDSKRYPNRPLYRAFNKYGVENFSIEILESCEEGILEEKEIEYIKQFQSYGKTGYNATLGGDGKRYLNIEKDHLLKVYKNTQSVPETARLLGIDPATCKKLLVSYSVQIVPVNLHQERRSRLSKKVLVEDIEFQNVYECAEFLIRSDVVDEGMSIRNIGLSIGRACKHNRKYKGLNFSFIEE